MGSSPHNLTFLLSHLILSLFKFLRAFHQAFSALLGVVSSYISQVFSLKISNFTPHMNITLYTTFAHKIQGLYMPLHISKQ